MAYKARHDNYMMGVWTTEANWAEVDVPLSPPVSSSRINAASADIANDHNYWYSNSKVRDSISGYDNSGFGYQLFYPGFHVVARGGRLHSDAKRTQANLNSQNAYAAKYYPGLPQLTLSQYVQMDPIFSYDLYITDDGCVSSGSQCAIKIHAIMQDDVSAYSTSNMTNSMNGCLDGLGDCSVSNVVYPLLGAGTNGTAPCDCSYNWANSNAWKTDRRFEPVGSNYSLHWRNSDDGSTNFGQSTNRNYYYGSVSITTGGR